MWDDHPIVLNFWSSKHAKPSMTGAGNFPPNLPSFPAIPYIIQPSWRLHSWKFAWNQTKHSMDSKDHLPNLHDFGFKMWMFFFHKAPMIFLDDSGQLPGRSTWWRIPSIGSWKWGSPSPGGDVLRQKREKHEITGTIKGNNILICSTSFFLNID